jgi:trk system potassium uptake protein TrkA
MNIMIIGCGRTGSAIAEALVQRGHGVTVVDRDPAAFERLGPHFRGTAMAGDGLDREVLLAAGIEKADGLAAVTASDEVNVVAGRVARQIFHVPKVVARLYDPRKAEIYRRLGLQTVSPLAWGVNRIVELLCYWRLETHASLGSGEVDLVDTEIPPLLHGRTVRDLTVPGEVHLVAITRKGKTFLPTQATELHEGDMAHLALLATSAERLKVLLGWHER